MAAEFESESLEIRSGLGEEALAMFQEVQELKRGADREYIEAARRFSKTFEHSQNPAERFEAVFVHASAARRANLHEEAIEWASKAYVIAVDFLKEEHQFRALNVLANAHAIYGNAALSIQMATKMRDLAIASKVESSISNAYQTLASCFSNASRHQEAIECFKAHLDLVKHDAEPSVFVIAYNNIGLQHATLGCWELALPFFEQARALVSRIDDLFLHVNVKANLAACRFNLNSTEEALNEYLEALEVSKQLGNKRILGQLYQGAADCLEELGRIDEAYDFFSASIEYQQEVFNEAKVAHTARLQARFETRLKERENELLQQRIAALREVNKKLEVLNKEKDHILHVVTHDLKNPLGAIKGFADFVVSYVDSLTETELLDIHKSIGESATNMRETVEELLALPTDSSERQIRWVKADVAQLVDRVIVSLTRASDAKQILLRVNLQPIVTQTDRNFFVRIAENLISNAIKYTPPAGEVSVELTVEQEDIVLRVQDNGPGISVEDQSKLFMRFQTLSAKPSAGEDSTGVGLHAAKKMAEALGGTITCESVLGQGALFCARLRFISPD